MACLAVKRLTYKTEDIREYFYQENLFKESDPLMKMDFEIFKKAFFP